MRDLFDTPPIPGLELRDDLLSEAEEAEMVVRCGALDLAPFRFQGWEGKRLTRSFGWHYDFESGALGEAEPIPAWLTAIRDRAARAFGRDPAVFAQALVIRYDPGAGIGWHRDRPSSTRLSGSRWQARPCWRSAAAKPMAGSTGSGCRSPGARPIFCGAKRAPRGSTASPNMIRCASR